ncbi:MAG: branched-chain amino acid ABC transporter permease [Deinococcota bacterium]|nr:branched-chain amino acid ABC transporter permease [Deinococcota bacterium]
MRGLLRDLLLVAALAVLLYFVPSFLRDLYGRASVSYLAIAVNGLTLAILALSWDILGRTGQLSLAHAAFYGAGAYSVAILLRTAELPLWLGIPLGGVVAAALALLLGSVTLRLKGIYFAIATLAFTEVLRAVVHQLPTRVAGGAAGINVAPLFRPQFVAGEMERWELAFLRSEAYFLVYAGLLVLALLISVYIQRSRLRAAFTAIRTNEQVAAVMGVRPARYKLLAFALSSFIVGLLGAVEAHRVGSVNPHETFSVAITVLALVTPIFGGLYTTLGPVLGAGLLSGLEETLRRTLSEGYLIGYGVVLVLSILFMPRGVVGLLNALGRRLGSRRRTR